MVYDHVAPVVLLIAGGKGGVGKSTISAALARSLGDREMRVGLLDADLSGPSQHLLFAAERMGAQGGRLVPSHVGAVSVVSMGLLAKAPAALVWSDGCLRSALTTLLEGTEWGDIDVLVVDLPPGSGAIVRYLTEAVPEAAVLFVTTGSDLAIADCRRDIAVHRRLGTRLLGIVANMSSLRCRNCGALEALHDESGVTRLGHETGLPIVARLPFSQSLDEDPALEELAEVCRTFIAGRDT